ncbi:hypothetical protein [uncultured Mediterranean phage uvMED]|nr:hypothetical protein [uncultured Mediterranean phage uvMED]BAR14154.1 hypothetical protein [uncultured Mediterranean phage uvMED]BAR15998.1 hypothetical protein [uncultured Mediterranean phage uvMED]
MAYIGREPQIGNFQVCDAISVVNGQAAYTMQVNSVNVSPETANHMLVSLNGVLQAPGSSYTVSGSTITFASNLVTGDVIDFIHILGSVLDLGVPSDSTVSLAKLTATGTKDATTFLRGDNTFAEAGGGKLLQTSLTTASTAQTISSATYADLTGMTVNITPVSSTSKFLITAHLNVNLPTTSGGSTDIGFNSKILRDSTVVVDNAVTSSYGSLYHYHGGSNIHLFDTIIGLDDHNTSSQVTIKVQGREPEGNTATFNLGSAKNSYLLVQEIET